MTTDSQPQSKRSVPILGRRMSFVDVGDGDPIVFLHGNPTSSYLWRNVIPHLSALGRCIAPDLIGMGDSDKVLDSGPERYRFVEHRRYLDAFLDVMGVERRVTLVVHDWGSALGFDWANRHREAVLGIAYMEGFVKPLAWSDWPASLRPLFQSLRSAAGEKMVLEHNLFIEKILPAAVLRRLTDAEMDAYRAPFREAGESRRPMLVWPRELPLDGTPADVTRIVADYSRWMQHNTIPKLFVNADPGAILVGGQRDFCRTWRSQTEVTVPGRHFLQEDSAEAIGLAIAEWYRGLS